MDSLPDSLNGDFRKMSLEVVTDSPNVSLQCEDYGGNLTLPHYGRFRPRRDYYVSNLYIMNFIISNLPTEYSHAFLYDERAMSKKVVTPYVPYGGCITLNHTSIVVISGLPDG